MRSHPISSGFIRRDTGVSYPIIYHRFGNSPGQDAESSKKYPIHLIGLIALSHYATDKVLPKKWNFTPVFSISGVYLMAAVIPSLWKGFAAHYIAYSIDKFGIQGAFGKVPKIGHATVFFTSIDLLGGE